MSKFWLHTVFNTELNEIEEIVKKKSIKKLTKLICKTCCKSAHPKVIKKMLVEHSGIRLLGSTFDICVKFNKDRTEWFTENVSLIPADLNEARSF